MSPPQLDQQEEVERIEALVSARLEQRLTAQLRDVGKVLLASIRAGCSVLESAASMGRHQLLREILHVFQTSADGIAPPDIRSDLRAATLAAASNDQPQCLQLLLDSCTSSPPSLTELLDARDTHGRTPLMISASRGHVECMRLLLEHSPETQVAAVDKNELGKNALCHAALNGHAACVRLLLAHSPHTQLVAAGPNGWSALMLAVASGQAACMQLLLVHSPDIQTADGSMLVSVAVVNAHVECLQLLLAHSPSQQQLDSALGEAGQMCMRQPAPPSPADEQRRERLDKCIGLLLSSGAMLPAQASEGAIAAIRPISKELAARALVPDMANEAVVGLALAATGRKRQASRRDAAAAGGPSQRARTSP